jgi:hypothetical protein
MQHTAVIAEPAPKLGHALPGAVLEAVARSLQDLRFGVIQLTVHDGRVVQLDVTERQRFT